MSSNLIVLDRVGADAPYVDVTAISGIYNGNCVTLGVRNSTGVYTVAAPSGITDLGLVLVLHEDLQYNVEYVNMDDVTFSAGDTLRALIMRRGDEISIPVANILATTAVVTGAYLIPDATKLPLECVASLGGTEKLALLVEGTYVKAGVTLARARVVIAD